MSDMNRLQHEQASAYSIVLFDGVCRLCNGWVQFLIRHDADDVFRFAPLQSDYSQSLLSSNRSDSSSSSESSGSPVIEIPDSVILIEHGVIFTHSSAVLHIFKRMGRLWALLYVLIMVPRPIRDAAYRYLAKRRYKLFGKYDSCMMPTEQVKRKFIG